MTSKKTSKKKPPKTTAASLPDGFRDRVKELRRVKASELVSDPENWRTHPPSQEKALRGVLGEIGLADVMICRELEDGRLKLIDGHLRKDITGDQDVPVVVTDLDEDEARALLTCLDPLSAMAGSSKEKLQEALAKIKTDNDEFKRSLTAVAKKMKVKTPWDIAKPGKTGDDVVPPQCDGVDIVAGDVFQLGNHRIMCGDSTRPQDLETLMDGDKAVLMATDPPYCVDYTGDNRPDGSGKDWSHAYREVDIKDLGEFMDAVFKTCLPHVDLHAGIYVWHAHLQYPVIASVFERYDLLLHQAIVWVKPVATYSHSFYRWRHEPCAFGWRRGNKPPHGAGKIDTVWEVDWEGKSRVVGNEHPTQKPVKLFEIPMEQHTERDDVVLEPFSGSGSQLIAAEKLGRKCRSMELSPIFVDVAIRRWEAFTGEKAQKVTSGPAQTEKTPETAESTA